MNSIKLQGRLTRDPEQKVGNSGVEFTKFSIAVDRKRSKEKAVDYFDCTAFQQTGALVAKYFKKGDGIIVSGRMESNKYTDKDGKNRLDWAVTVEEVEFPIGKGKADRTETTPSEPSAAEAELPF